MLNGADGIPLTGRVEAYATEMWLDDPSAFWLHPEGPLSETTPAEYRARMAEEERQRQAAAAQNPYANAYSQMARYYALAGLQNSPVVQAGAQLYQGQYSPGQYIPISSSVGRLFGM